MPSGKIWIQHGHVILRDGQVFFWVDCPCECEPKVLASAVVNGEDEGRSTWDLTPYQKPKMGTPGYKWRLKEVGDPRTCSGTEYIVGDIDECGTLVGLPNKFTSSFSYDGYMEIQQGCPDEDGEIVWPCPN